MNVTLREPWTVERFLQWEDRQEGRHEFDGENIIEMTGGSRNHQYIVGNLFALLRRLLDRGRFDVVTEMRVAGPRWVRYPDVLVTPGRLPGRTRTVRDAVVLFEVLSDDTADNDRAAKPANYLSLPGAQRYVLLEQDRIGATILARGPGGWTEAAAPDAIDLPELGVRLPWRTSTTTSASTDPYPSSRPITRAV